MNQRNLEINITTIRNIKKIISLSNIAKAIHEDYYQKASIFRPIRELPITRGRIHFVRLADEKGIL
ncbi:MAG: hypothetical protein MRK02_04300 [Candidatus Scalindua sp.]|nr:hypothetical protein [Candidatus Scalindua sp.]